MLSQILLQKEHHMPHGHCGPCSGQIAFRRVAECHHANVVSRRSNHLASLQQLVYQLARVSHPTAAETLQCHREHDRISHRAIQTSGTFLDLANDHVRPVVERAKHRIDHEGLFGAVPALTSNKFMTRARKPDRKNVEIGHGPRLIAVCLKHWILRNGEVPVDVKVGLNDSDGGIHSGSLYRPAARFPPSNQFRNFDRRHGEERDRQSQGTVGG